MGQADALAIGGGLAGAAFAVELARSGGRVTVLERARAPQPKVCGDFLSAEALDLLAYLGVDACRLGASEIGRLTLATDSGAATAGLPFRAGGVSRFRLDEALLTAAADAGAEVVRGVTVTGLVADANGAEVASDRGAFAGRWAALSTGKHNLRGWPRRAGAVTGFKIQAVLSPAATADLRGRVQLALFDGGYVGACLVEGGIATICWQIETAVLKRDGARWQDQIARFARAPAFGDLVAGARFAAPRPVAISNLPFCYLRRRPIAPGVFPVGDQIAVVPAFTGDGTSIALASGILAARALIAGRSAADYQRAFIGGLRAQFILARAVSAVLDAGWRRKLAVGVVAALPALAASIARATRLPAAVRPSIAA